MIFLSNDVTSQLYIDIHYLSVFAGPNLTPHADPILTPYLS
jgi:hypothetical protein